jgi:hypothetical protein
VEDQQTFFTMASFLEVHDGYKQATWRHAKSWFTAVVSGAIPKVVKAACRYERTLDERLADRLILCRLLDTGSTSGSPIVAGSDLGRGEQVTLLCRAPSLFLC